MSEHNPYTSERDQTASPHQNILPGGVSEQNEAQAKWNQFVKNHEERLKNSYPKRNKPYLTPNELDKLDQLSFELKNLDRKNPKFKKIQDEIDDLLGLKPRPER